MINKFRRKFVGYATVSIFTLLLLIFAAINIVNFSMLANEADNVTQLLADAGGEFKEIDPPSPIPPSGDTSEGQGFNPGEFTPPEREGRDGLNFETRMSTRYFTVKIDDAGNATMLRMAMENQTVAEGDAVTWAKSLSAGIKGWTRTYFRYRTYQYQGQTYVSVIHYARELTPSYRLLWSSVIGGSLGVLVSFLVLIPVSKLFVKPLQTSIKRQQRFISDASHELKTPLTIISANTEIIEMESGASESTQAITKQVGRLNTMVRNLNALARIDEAPSHLAVSDIDLSTKAKEICEGFAEAFRVKSVQFDIEIQNDVHLRGDEPMISKLLSVLLENAQKYALTTAEFHLYRNKERVTIKVINDAEGIEDGPLDRVFERFYRSDAARSSAVEGSGLGLSIAKEIVSRHDGRIAAKGENGKFVIKIEF